jgi:hypothetical protein
VAAFAASQDAGQSAANDAKAAAVQRGASLPTYQGEALKQLLASEAPPAWSTAVGVSSGPAAAVSTVQAAALVLVQAEINTRALPNGTATTRNAFVGNSRGMAQRQLDVRSIWDSAVASKEVEVNRNDLNYFAEHPEIETFDAAQVSLQRWNSTIVSGANASVTFTGNSQRHSNETGTWVDEGLHQWQLQLRRGGDGSWRLTSEVVLMGADYDEQ